MPRPPAAPALLALALLAAAPLAACGGGGKPAPSRLPAEGDAVIFQRILDGELAAAEGFQRISDAGGFPIATSQGFLFAVLDVGVGPYRLTFPGGQAADVTMKAEAGTGWALVPLAAPEGVAYRFLTRFSDPFTDGWARRFEYGAGGETGLVRAAGAHLERFPGVGGGAVAARTLRVWVPAQPPARILYAHDGQNLFGPNPFGGWNLQGGAGPATLIVGIDNTAARFDEYTPVQDVVGGGLTGGRAGDYLAYLVGQVVPFIESRFGAAGRRGLLGSSLGGLVSLEAALTHPATFEFAASLSGTVGWGSIGAGVHDQTVIEAFAALPGCPAPRLYLDTGGGPGPGTGCADADGDGIEDDYVAANKDNYCENVQLARVLTGKGCGATLTYVWAPQAQHDEAAWRARAPAILALFEAP